MDLKLFLVRTARAFRRDGITKTFGAAVRYVRATNGHDPFDSKHGTDTRGIVPLWTLKIASSNARFGWGYETSDPQELRRSVERVPEDPGNLCFIDMGCGKGRMLIAARELGFRKLIGIEFAPELVDIANANLVKTGTTGAAVLNSDASDFAFPAEDFLLYLFNPFSEEVMKRVLENMRRVRNRKGFVIYNNARCAELLDSSGFLCRIASVEGTRHPTIIWSIQTPTESFDCARAWASCGERRIVL